MKNIIFVLLSTFILLNATAQFGPENIISSITGTPRAIFAIDIDSDGDQDILAGLSGHKTVVWYENLDGLGNFGPENIITENLNDIRSVFAIDMDGDGDIDVLSSSPSDDKIYWYENEDTQGSSWIEHLVNSTADEPYSVFAIDLDGDGDNDILTAFVLGNKIIWFENTDGLGSFGAQQIINNNALSARSVYACDIDGDGDNDVVFASAADDKVAWHENIDGLGNFGLQQIISTNADSANTVFAIDIDGDADIDVLSASSADDKIAWYENLDGQGNFGAQQIISTNAIFAQSVYATDLDNDGDNDVLSASHTDNKIAWYENTDGLGSFGAQQIISTDAQGARDVHTSDLDGDGDQDVISASIVDSKIAWYENLHPIGVNENALLRFRVYPIPTTGMLSVQSKTKITQLKIYNKLGQLVARFSNQNKIDISALSQDIYFIKISDQNGNIGIEKIVKR